MTHSAPGSHRTWLVAHDLTPCGSAATEVALAEMLDAAPGGTLLLLHVLTPVVVGRDELLDAGTFTEDAALEAERSLARVADLLVARADGRVCVDMQLEIGASPTEVILEVARLHDVERVIVGTHGRRGISRLLLGSVAEVVARRAEMPVLVVHAPLEQEEWEVTEAQIVG